MAWHLSFDYTSLGIESPVICYGTWVSDPSHMLSPAKNKSILCSFLYTVKRVFPKLPLSLAWLLPNACADIFFFFELLLGLYFSDLKIRPLPGSCEAKLHLAS